MKTLINTTFAILFAAALIANAHAGDGDGDGNRRRHTYYSQHHPSYNARHYYSHPRRGYYGYGYGAHASTYVEGVLRGKADVIRAKGEFNHNTAIALNYLEEAKSRAYDNELKRADTFFAKRALNKAARTTVTPEEAAARRIRVANAARPDRLGPSQYRPDLGLINWPTLLERAEFSELRNQVDRMLADGLIALNRHGVAIDRNAAAMREAMRPLAKSVNASEYAAASRFLKSLRYESQLAIRGTINPAATVATR